MLKRCDFFLWGHLKDIVYSKNRRTLEQLEQFICQTGIHFSRDIAEGFVLCHATATHCGHFESIPLRLKRSLLANLELIFQTSAFKIPKLAIQETFYFIFMSITSSELCHFRITVSFLKKPICKLYKITL